MLIVASEKERRAAFSTFSSLHPAMPKLPQALAAAILYGAVFPAIWVAFGWRLILRLVERKVRALLRLPLSAPDKSTAASTTRLLASPPLTLPRATHEWVETSARPPVKLHVVRLAPAPGVTPSGRTILCVHGFPEFWAAWAPAMAALAADGHALAAVDMRGYGESDKPAGVGAYGIGSLAADIVAVAEHLKRETGAAKITIFGHDWGGQVTAHAVALGGPDLFEACALLCIPFPGAFVPGKNAGLRQAARSWYIFFFQAPFLGEEMMCGRAAAAIGALVKERQKEARERAEDDAARAKAVEAAAGLTPPPPLLEFSADAEDAAFRGAFLRPGAATATISYYRALVRGMLGLLSPKPVTGTQAAAFKARLRGKAGFDVPLLMLFAARDTALGTELLSGTDALVADLELRVLDSSHWLPAVRPREVIARLRAFVGRTGAR